MRLLRLALSLVLVALVLSFSGGLTIAKHYCKAELVDLAINTDLEKCKAAEDYSPLPNHPVVSKKSCCRDEIASFKLVQHQVSKQTLVQDWHAALVLTHAETHEPLTPLHDRIWQLANPPPLLDKTIYKTLECYLI